MQLSVVVGPEIHVALEGSVDFVLDRIADLYPNPPSPSPHVAPLVAMRAVRFSRSKFFVG